MKRTLAGIVLSVAALSVLAAPPPERAQLSQRGCAIAADMTLVARALAVEKVERERASRIMALVYVSYDSVPEAARLRESVLALAWSRSEKPVDLARIVGEACLRSDGDQGAMFGTRIHWTY